MTTEDRRVAAALASTELFLGLPKPVLEEALTLTRVRSLAKGARMFRQGDQGVRAHVLIEGGVRISQSGSEGAEVVIRFIGPGQIFGAVALFTDGRYPADAVTFIDSLEASWSEPELLGLITRHPPMAINLIKIVGRRLQEVQERVREASTQSVERRLAHAVLRLVHQAGRPTAEGTAIDFPLRRKDLADIAGATLHSVSRILTVWEKAGMLASHNQRLVVRKLSDIQRIAADSAD
jgi:CRP-like cAMP-binding protein